MHVIPNKITENILKIYNLVKGKSIQFVDVIPEKFSKEFDCHNNCDKSIFKKIIGYYVVMDLNVGCYNLVKHSIIRKDDKLIDITPNKVKQILFIETDELKSKFYSYLEGYLYMNYSNVKNLPETIKDYYVYGLVDPRTEQIFYVGKGKKNRWINHMLERNLNENTHKCNVIKKIHSSGFNVGVIFLEKNIEDEKTAYELEEKYIKQFGKIHNGGILTNVCDSYRPPNHKGKTYEEIYGDKAEFQKELRRNLQLEAGGWFKNKNHSDESKLKISEASIGLKNGNSNGLTEEDYLQIGKDFCEQFNYKISKSKWIFYCSKNNIPTALNTFRFNRKYILKVFEENFNSKIEWEKQMWFNDGIKQIRLSEWVINENGIPNGFEKGRLK